METKETNWSKYTKDELVAIVQHIERAGSFAGPWSLRDAVFAVEKVRNDRLLEEMRKCEEGATEARRKVSELASSEAFGTIETFEAMSAELERADEFDKRWVALNRQWEKLHGIK